MTEPETVPGEDGPARAGELAARLSRVEKQLAGFHQRAAHRESVIDELHAENQLLKAGLGGSSWTRQSLT